MKLDNNFMAYSMGSDFTKENLGVHKPSIIIVDKRKNYSIGDLVLILENGVIKIVEFRMQDCFVFGKVKETRIIWY